MRAWRSKMYNNRTALICLILLFFFTAIALLAFLIAPDSTKDANRQSPRIALRAPGYSISLLSEPNSKYKESRSGIISLFVGKVDDQYLFPVDSIAYEGNTVVSYFEGTKSIHETISSGEEQVVRQTFLLGTDKYGRDILSRIILGLRSSLFIGFAAVILSILLGAVIGMIGGYFGGKIDSLIMLLINTAWSIPTILMAFAIILVLGKGFWVIVLAVTLTMWVDVARIVRGETLQLKSQLFIQATKVLGLSNFKTIFRHILPNLSGTLLVMAAANFATAVLVEAGLSFLGLGIQPPSPSLGNMLQENYAYATGGYVYLAIFPIVAIMILVLTFNLLGTSLRDVFDVKTTKNK